MDSSIECLDIKFVIPIKCERANDASAEMRMAFDMCKTKCGIEPQWVRDEECSSYNCNTLTKRDVFVFEVFSGESFKHLCKSKSLIVGPPCLLACLTEGLQVPPHPNPIYSVAMRDVLITTSGLTKGEKAKLKELIEWMGGAYEMVFTDNTTHLISNCVKSVKYYNAGPLVPIMKAEWVYSVWEASLKGNVLGTSKEFVQKYKLPPFYNIEMTSTCLTAAEKNAIQNIITSNGGTYTGHFSGETTKVLIMARTSNALKSDKSKGAATQKTDRVLPQWIYDSAKKGYALDMEPYRIVNVSSSTPTKSNTNVSGAFPNESIISIIPNISDASLGPKYIDETLNSTNQSSTSSKGLKVQGVEFSFDLNVDEKELSEAGLFLDGCGVFLSGFPTECREILYKILNSSGATRYDDISERITHVLVGKSVPSDLQAFRDRGLCPQMVDASWLKASIRMGKPAYEGKPLDDVNAVEPPSPMTKKNMQKLKNRPAVIPFLLDEVQEPDSVIQQYIAPLDVLEPNATYGQEESTVAPEDNEMIVQCFIGRKFTIAGFDSSEKEELIKIIAEYGGTVIRRHEEADYIVVPVICSVPDLPPKSAVVTDLWINDCIDNGEELHVKSYFHVPIKDDGKLKPLTGVVLSISIYHGIERSYLVRLAEYLGAKFQDAFPRKDKGGLLASTHLICPDAAGDKYKACIKWGLPAVTHQWLITSYQKCRLVPEGPFLVGDTKSPARSPLSDLMSTHVGAIKRKHENMDENISPKKVGKLETPKENRLLCTPKPLHKQVSNIDDDVFVATQTPPPVSKILENLRKKAAGTPDSPGPYPTPECLKKMKTPDTPYGAFLYGPNPSASVRKRWKKWSDAQPEFVPEKVRTPSTPWDVVLQRCWDNIGKMIGPMEPSKPSTSKSDDNSLAKPNDGSPDLTKNAPPSIIDAKLQQLDQMLATTPSTSRKGSFSGRAGPSKHALDCLDVAAPEFVVKQSQAESVGWRDPSELRPSAKFSVRPTGPSRQRPPKFMLTSVADIAERALISSIVEDLGGEVSVLEDFDASSSHLICNRPTRSAKILGAMASGTWTLSSQYIHACKAKNEFINEEDFEWGNPIANPVLPLLTPKEQEIALSLHRWRLKLNSGIVNPKQKQQQKGAFLGFRVVLYNIEKASQFEKLIRAGAGEIVPISAPFTSVQPGQVTHVFFEKNKSLDHTNLRHLNRIGVLCLPITYLNLWLMTDPPPDPKMHQITA